MAERAVTTDPSALIAGVRRGLALAAQPGQPSDWQAVGLVLALQGALALALVAYDTADPTAVLDPAARGEAPKLAPVPLLLRRASSPDHLADPERLSVSRGERRSLEALMGLRNRLLHPLEKPPTIDAAAFADHRGAAVRVLRHLLFEAPAFDPSRHALDLAAISDHLRALE